MDEIVARVPVFVSAAGRDVVFGPQRTKGVCARFIIDPFRPDLVAVSTDAFILWLSRTALTTGLHLRTFETCGTVSVRPYVADEVTWLVIDIDRPGFPAAQVSTRLFNVEAFLLVTADLLDFADPDVFERMVPRPFAVREIEHEWPLRSDGGAA